MRVFIIFAFVWSTGQALSQNQLDSAFIAGKNLLRDYQAKETAALNSGQYLPSSSPSSRHQYGTKANTPKGYSQQANLFCAATHSLVSQGIVRKGQVANLQSENLRWSYQARTAQAQCLQTVAPTGRCLNVNRYTFDGSCNNPSDAARGRTNSCHKRLQPPAYDDGVDQPRWQSYVRGQLPNERRISLLALSQIAPENDPEFNHNRMSFGQFLAHDITLTPTTTIGPNNDLPDCCNPSNRMLQCFPIQIPAGDPVFRNMGCMNFVRSEPCPTCNLGAREQQNAVTPFVDLSHIYGLTVQENRNLRTMTGGRLRGQAPYGGRFPYDFPLLMPSSNQPNDGCSSPGQPCFLGGDPLRVNQQIGISAWSTLWFRYHNFLADAVNIYAMNRLNQRWSDERIFQTARRIAQAQMQLIVYREWLPTIVGNDLMAAKGLGIGPGRTRYDQSVDPTLWSEFAGGAFRFGHSLVQNEFRLNNVNYNNLNTRVSMADAFSTIPNYYNLRSQFVAEHVVAGMYTQPGKKISFSFVPGVVHHVYRNRSEPFGMDLPALNIHRGRDHGLQPYYVYAEQNIAEAMGSRYKININSWNDLRSFWKRECLDTLPRIYQHVRDVDLYVGGLCENPIQPGSVGPTMGVIIANQFSQLRYGDRLFASHETAFTPSQYQELFNTGFLYSIVCASAVEQPSVFFDAFRYRQNRSPINCNALPKIDVGLFMNVAADL